MAILVTDPTIEEFLLAQVRASSEERRDEVWEGVLMMTPMANIEHQKLATRLVGIIYSAISSIEGANVFAGINLSDRVENWTWNYRIPDVAVYLPGNPAQDCDTHWAGGPDFAAEVISPHDHSREKLPFYGQVGTRELLLVDRDPWSLELWRLDAGQMKRVGTSSLAAPETLASDVLPLSFRLVSGEKRPHIHVAQIGSTATWLI